MLIVLTGLRPTLWFADVRGASQYRKFLFARVVHDGKPLFCGMCVITRVDVQNSWHSSPLIASGFTVRELGLGLTPVRYTNAVIGTRFETVCAAQEYAIKWAWRTLSSPRTQESILYVVDMYVYDESYYKNWEPVCL